MKWVLAVAVVSLLVAAGGAGAAAIIDGGDVKNGSLTGKDVRNKSLTKRDFRGSVRGPRGFTGPQGPAGPSVLGQITVVRSPQVFYGPTDVAMLAIAFCPAGQRAISGGGQNVADEQIALTEATGDRSGWGVIGIDLVDNGGEYVQAQALCVPAGQAVAASRGAARAKLTRKLQQVRSELATEK